MIDLIAEARALLDAVDAADEADHGPEFWRTRGRLDDWMHKHIRALLDRCAALQRERDAAMEMGGDQARYAREFKAERDALQRERDEAIGQRNRALNALKLDTDERDAALAERDALQEAMQALTMFLPNGVPCYRTAHDIPQAMPDSVGVLVRALFPKP